MNVPITAPVTVLAPPITSMPRMTKVSRSQKAFGENEVMKCPQSAPPTPA